MCFGGGGENSNQGNAQISGCEFCIISFPILARLLQCEDGFTANCFWYVGHNKKNQNGFFFFSL